MIRVLSRLILSLCLLSTYAAAADSAAVVVDVSGSMSTYGSWQSDAKEAIASILSGAGLPARWESNPKTPDITEFSCGPTCQVTLIRFGSILPTADYPFFDRIQNSLSLAEFEAQFPVAMTEYSQARTNTALAEGVAIRSAGASGSTAHVIMISDFLKDANPSARQLSFVNEIQPQYAKYTIATLSWTGNPNVQIKLLKFVPLLTPVEPGDHGPGVLHLSHIYEKESGSVVLHWNYEGPVAPQKYDVKIIDRRQGKTLFSKDSLGGNRVTYPKAEPGPIRCSVTAYLPDGKTVEESAEFNVPGQPGSPVAVLILLLAIAAALGTGIMYVKKYGLPDFVGDLKKRFHTDI